ncbi:hypothetical protein AKJ16_DCAP08123 [Drosera capensis]
MSSNWYVSANIFSVSSAHSLEIYKSIDQLGDLQCKSNNIKNGKGYAPSAAVELPSRTVQEIADTGEEVPDRYIYQDNMWIDPSLLPWMPSTVVTDLQLLLTSQSELAKLRSALNSWGCFQVRAHCWMKCEKSPSSSLRFLWKRSESTRDLLMILKTMEMTLLFLRIGSLTGRIVRMSQHTPRIVAG